LGRPPPEEEVIIEVAAAVLQRPDGSFLLAQRPACKVYAGYWEFPGGKVEPGEPAPQALARELHEELGIEIGESFPWITRVFTYPHGTVRLNFFRVHEWTGEPKPREEQAIAWQAAGTPSASPMLPANAPVLASLALPVEYAVTDAMTRGIPKMLAALEARLQTGLKLLQVREPGLSAQERGFFTHQAIALAHRHGCKVLTKSPFPGADGVHVTSTELMTLREKPAAFAAASCHDREELERAMALGLDFAVLGPVREKSTGDKSPPLGWKQFADIVRGTTLPVYAIGGLTSADLPDAWRAGAHGIAMIRAAWS
jgi:8-oxo-dGTP diphosphatase